jgi:hypothetical protein
MQTLSVADLIFYFSLCVCVCWEVLGIELSQGLALTRESMVAKVPPSLFVLIIVEMKSA